MEEVLKRYYKGETTLAEERELRSAWQRGELPGEPILGLRGPMEIPEGLNEKLQRYIRQKRQRKIRQLWITAGSIAAMAVLILSFRGTFTTTPRPGIQLSDNLKKERFENALRVLGNALEDEKTPVQRVLYEDHNDRIKSIIIKQDSHEKNIYYFVDCICFAFRGKCTII